MRKNLPQQSLNYQNRPPKTNTQLLCSRPVDPLDGNGPVIDEFEASIATKKNTLSEPLKACSRAENHLGGNLYHHFCQTLFVSFAQKTTKSEGRSVEISLSQTCQLGRYPSISNILQMLPESQRLAGLETRVLNLILTLLLHSENYIDTCQYPYVAC